MAAVTVLVPKFVHFAVLRRERSSLGTNVHNGCPGNYAVYGLYIEYRVASGAASGVLEQAARIVSCSGS